jgi:hypothetical protein
MGLNFIHRDAHLRVRPPSEAGQSGFAGRVIFWNEKQAFMRATGWLRMVVCALALSLVPSAAAQEGNDGGTAAAIRALEHQWADGQSRNDNRVLDLIFDNSLVYVEYGKLVTKGEYLLRVKEAGPQISQIVMEPMIVRSFGTTAIVCGTYREKEVKGGKPAVKRWRFVDTWVYKKGGWVLVAAAAAPVTPE